MVQFQYVGNLTTLSEVGIEKKILTCIFGLLSYIMIPHALFEFSARETMCYSNVR